MQADTDPLQTEDENNVEPVEILMVEATDDFDMKVEKGEYISTIADVEIQMAYP